MQKPGRRPLVGDMAGVLERGGDCLLTEMRAHLQVRQRRGGVGGLGQGRLPLGLPEGGAAVRLLPNGRESAPQTLDRKAVPYLMTEMSRPEGSLLLLILLRYLPVASDAAILLLRRTRPLAPC